MMLTNAHNTAVTAIRAGFVRQGTTFRAWCIHSGVDPGYAYKVAAGKHNGPAAQKLRSRITAAAEGNPAHA